MLRWLPLILIFSTFSATSWAQLADLSPERVREEELAFDVKILEFLNQSRSLYSPQPGVAEAQMEGDLEKIRTMVQEFVAKHPGVRLSTCDLVKRGEHRFHFNGRRSAMLAEERRLIQTSINNSIDPNTLAIYGGTVVPVNHNIDKKTLTQGSLDETYDQFKAYWKTTMQLIRDHQLEVVKIKVALRHFRRWSVNRDMLTKFIAEDLKVDPSLVEWVERTSLPSGRYFELTDEASNDPMVDLDIAFGILNFECTLYAPNDIQLTIHTGAGLIRAFLEDVPVLAPEYQKSRMFKVMFEELTALSQDAEFLDLRKQIRDKSKCGFTLSLELRKARDELQRNPTYSPSVGLGTTFYLQGWHDPQYRRVFKPFDMDPFRFRYIDKDDTGIINRDAYIKKMKSILQWVEDTGVRCTRPTADWIED